MKIGFKRGEDPKKSLKIGLEPICQDMIKKLGGLLFNETQTQQILNFQSDEFWEKQKPNTASDFMEPFLLNKYTANRMVIGYKNNKFIILRDDTDNPKFSKSEYLLEDLYHRLKQLFIF